MATTKAVWGIDVGRCALTAIKLKPGADGAIELVGADYIEHAKILSQPDADRHALINEALEKFLSRNDISKDDVVVSVPGQHTLARFTKLPPVAPKRIPDIVRYEADQQIPFDMDEVIWDYQTFQQEDLPDIEVGIFAMKRELIREHLLHFEQAAVEPIAVQPTPVAVYNAVAHEGLLTDETTIVLDIGADNTDLIIATPYSFWTRTIQKGGNSCTEALVKSFKLSFSKAENLKRTAETSKYRRQIFQAMRPVFADLVQELQRSIGFYSSTHRDASITRVVGVGNAFKLPGLQKYLQQNLGLDVHCPEKVTKTGQLSASAAEQPLSMWSAYGLALHGLDQSRVASNLLPTEIAKQVVWRKKKPTFAAAAACIALAGGIIWFRHSTDMRTLAAAAGNAYSIAEPKIDAANRIIDGGPSASSAPLERAAQILKAGKALKKEFSSLSGKGDEERAIAEELIRIHASKALVPRIYEVIHESVPAAEIPGASIDDPDALRNAIRSLQTPRNERRMMWIESVNMQYSMDVNEQIWPDPIVDPPEPINDAEAETPGFKITITCVTPLEDGRSYVAETFLSSLLENGRKAGLGFYIDRAHLMYGNRYQATEDGEPMVATPGFGNPIRPRFGNTERPREAPRDGYKLDPLTDEPLDQDWRFEIWVDAIRGDFPELEEETEETEE